MHTHIYPVAILGLLKKLLGTFGIEQHGTHTSHINDGSHYD